MKIKTIFSLPQTYLPISACLLGINTKYSGSNNLCASLLNLADAGYFVPIPFCPEQLGGLKTPREKSEICGEKVVMINGDDVSIEFHHGAQEALKLLRLYRNVKFVLLKSYSPSCGVGAVYDGSFSGTKVSGNGIAAQLFIDNGYCCVGSDVFSQPLKTGYYLGLAEKYSERMFGEHEMTEKGCFFYG